MERRNERGAGGRGGAVRRWVVWLLWAGTVTGCTSSPQVFSTDLTRQSGVYVVGYTEDVELRQAFEDRLVADLTARDITAHASYPDLPDLGASTADDLVREANRRAAVGVVLVNQATAEASGSPVRNPARVTPLHPDIQSFYRLSRDEMQDARGDGRPVFAEVNLFLVDGSSTRLFWSGTTWSFQEGDRDEAVGRVSQTIAEQMSAAREQLNSGN